MAFSIFSKPTNKPKAGEPTAKTRVRQPDVSMSPANDSRKPDSTLPRLPDTGSGPKRANPNSSMMLTGEGPNWRPSHGTIVVGESRTELCSALENAALFYSNGQVDSARQTLSEAVVNDIEARRSMLAWLALFDLLQRAGDKAAFDGLALKFAHLFERSPPTWEEHRVGVSRPSTVVKGAGVATVRFTGSLAADGLGQLDALFKATTTMPKCRLDFSGVTAVEEKATPVAPLSFRG